MEIKVYRFFGREFRIPIRGAEDESLWNQISEGKWEPRTMQIIESSGGAGDRRWRIKWRDSAIIGGKF